MKCAEIRQWISPYIDNELEAETHLLVTEHLDECKACQKLFRSEASFESLVSTCLKQVDGQTNEAWARALGKLPSKKVFDLRHWPRAVAASFIFIFLMFVSWQGWSIASTDFIRSTVGHHNLYLKEKKQLTLQTSSPKELHRYFADRMEKPKCMKLLFSTKVRTIGGGITYLKNDVPAALVVCHIKSQPVSIFLFDDNTTKRFKQKNMIGEINVPKEFRHRGATIIAMKRNDGIICAVSHAKYVDLKNFVKEQLEYVDEYAE